LQQDQIQSKKAAANREKKVEKHIKEQAREITALKRKRCHSCSTEGTSNSSSAPKLARKTNTAAKKKPPPATKQAVHVLMSEAVKEAENLEIDNSEEGIFQASLSKRGWESKDIPSEFLDVEYFYNFKKSGGLKPLGRDKVMPKLLKRGIPTYILLQLSSAQLAEMLYLIQRILFETKTQQQGVPHYLPGPYRNKDLTTVMCLEKIWYLSPAAHFAILRNPSFFSVDRLGVQNEFYEIMMSTASGESPVNLVMTASSNFMGFTFTATDQSVLLAQGVSRKVINPPPQETLLHPGTPRSWRLTRRRSKSPPPTPPSRRSSRSPALPSRSPSWPDVKRSGKGRRRY
jgi:hypothetical protein